MSNHPVTWQEVSLEDFGEIVGGGTPSRNNPAYWNGEIPWVTPGEISSNEGKYLKDTREKITLDGLNASAAKLLPPGAVLVTTRATLGEAAVAAMPVSTNQGFKSIIPNDATDSTFAYYRISTLKQEMVRLASGTTFLEISKADFARIRTFRPELDEQVRIATALDTIDEAIAKTEAVIAKLKQVRTGLLHDLLTHGLDEHGQLRDPIAHPEQFKDSPMGRVPKEWDVALLSRFVPVAEYGISSSLGSKGIPILRMNNFENGEAKLDDLKYSSSYVPPKLSLKNGDVLFNRTNSWEHVGRTGIWRGQIEQASFASYLVRLNPRRDLLNPELLNYWLNWAPTQIRMRRYATPAVQQVNINPTNLRMMDAAFPNRMEEQEEIVRLIQAEDSTILKSRCELSKLQQLKSGLSDDLLTGRVRVPEGVTTA